MIKTQARVCACKALLGIGSEIWSAPAAPIQHAAALAFTEPAKITARIAASRSLHATVARAMAGVCAAAGLLVPPPQAAPDPLTLPWIAATLARLHEILTDLASPASAPIARLAT